MDLSYITGGSGIDWANGKILSQGIACVFRHRKTAWTNLQTSRNPMNDRLSAVVSALERIGQVKVTGDSYIACCPAHDDKTPSLSVSSGSDGRALLFCHAGCSPEQIIAQLGLSWTDLFPDSTPGESPIISEYEYRDPDGTLLYVKERCWPKRFVYRHLENGNWVYNARNIERVPYRLPELLEAISKDRGVLYVEGEKDVERLRGLDIVASTSGGVNDWRPSYAEYFKGGRVTIIPDNDAPGKKHATQVLEALTDVAKSCAIVELPGLPDKGDISDWFNLGGTKGDLARIIKGTSLAIPPLASSGHSDLSAELVVVASAILWPGEMAEMAKDVVPSDFANLKYSLIWESWLELREALVQIDTVAIADKLRLKGLSVHASELDLEFRDVPFASRTHVDIILRHKATRDIISICDKALADIKNNSDPYAIGDRIVEDTKRVGDVVRPVSTHTFHELMDMKSETDPWVVRGMLRLKTRAILVAAEGGSKSTQLRVIATCAAQGIHPYTHNSITPIRSLIVDLENPISAIQETGVRLRKQLELASRHYDPQRSRVWLKPEGLDIRDRKDRSDLISVIAEHKPHLVCIGPLYKFYQKLAKETYEEAAEKVLTLLDQLRIKYNFALVIEHHAAKGSGSQKSREMTPFGSQRWMAWPELGITLKPDDGVFGPGALKVGRFRSGDRYKVWWPDYILRDKHFLVKGYWDNPTAEIEDLGDF